MIKILRVWLFVWAFLSSTLVLNLYPVRNSGIFLGAALLSGLLALLAVLVMRRPDLFPWRSRLAMPLLALALTAVASGLQGALFYDRRVVGEHRYALVQIYAVVLILLSVGAAFAVATLIRARSDMLWLRRIIVAATVVLMFRATFKFYYFPVTQWWPLVASHAMALLLASVLFEPHRGWWRYALGTVFALSIVGDVAVFPFFAHVPAQWLSGWVAVGIPLGLLVLIRFPRTIIAVGVPLALGFLYWKLDLVQRVIDLSRNEGDFLRFRLWEDAVRLTFLRPFLGLGPGNYLDYITRYGQLGALMSSPHGNYQQVAAEMGLVGLGFMLWLIYRVVAVGWSIFRRSTEPLVRSLSIAVTCSIAGQFCAAFLGDFVLPSYHNGGYNNISATAICFAMIGLLMSLERLETQPALGFESATATEPELLPPAELAPRGAPA